MVARIPELTSVVVTSYNYARFARSCIASLARQTYGAIEVIVVDDASTDDSLEVLEECKAAFCTERPNASFVTVVLPRHVGYAGALTIGFFLTQGEYIAVQDLDDLSHEDRIARQVEVLRHRASLGLVGSAFAYFQDGHLSHPRPADWIRYAGELVRTYTFGGTCMCGSTLLFRGELFDQVGGLTRCAEGAEDAEFIRMAIERGFEADNVPDTLYFARIHPSQRSRREAIIT